MPVPLSCDKPLMKWLIQSDFLSLGYCQVVARSLDLLACSIA